MKKIEYGECANCEYCDCFSEKSWCKNPKGDHFGETEYHIADTGCDKWKPCEEYKEELRKENEVQKPSYGNGYIANPWSEWEKKAYRKGLYME